MSLPVNIEELLHGHTVEWERIECKQGWNPEDVMHTVCAFANDINNWGGGYIFVGVAEENGKPVLPPEGLPSNSLDKIQKELLNLSHKIQPYYAPVAQPYVLNGKHILVIWVPGGDNRPYRAPTTMGDKGQHRYYIRRGTNSVVAKLEEERVLLEMAKRVPFDDRISHQASIDQLSFGIIRSFLQEIKSDLADEAPRMSLADLSVQMHIAAGPREDTHPLNAGLLFFAEQPHLFFKGAKTEIVIYEDSTGTVFTENSFTGPLHMQLRAVLSFLHTNILKEKVIKHARQAEADRVFNFPPAALEEVIANAFYHRSYELESPIEVNCFSDRIEVLTFPGPLPPVTKDTLKQTRIVARNYRNRRVGDFLKELKLTEGRATGFPTIYKSMLDNGSPKPVFDTDDNFSYFLAILRVHPEFLKEDVQPEEKELQILLFCLKPQRRSEILKKIGYSNHPKNYQRYILPLLERGWLAYTRPNTPSSPKQQYVTTDKGKSVLG